MKRFAAIVTAGVLALSMLTACGDSSSKADTSSKAESSSKSDSRTADSNVKDFYDQKVVESPEWLSKLDAAKDAEQLIVVAGVGETTAFISMHEKNKDGKWEMLLQTPGYIGLEGLGKADCDHAITPAGTYTIDKAFGLADDPGCQMEYTKCDDNYYWSGDAREGMHFNELVNINDVPGLDPEECEHIADFKYEYKYCLNLGYNSKEMDPKNGCAFFFHCQGLSRPFTGGCVAVSEPTMKLIMQKIKPGCKITIDKADTLGIDVKAMRAYNNEKGV